MTIFLTAPSLIRGFQFLADKKPTTAVVSDIFAADLNGDGVQEAIFVGRQTQPATISTWSNSTIHIFQVNASGAWGETTNSLLPDNVIQGSEPNVLVGDFNNDGRVDFFVPSDTDMNYLVPSYLFLNTGSNFTKHAFDFQTWAHGAYVADVNQDGYLDVLSTDYGPRAGIGFGGPSGFTYKSNDLREGFGFTSSGISAADFMGDGSVTILVSDNVGYPSETGLFSWNINSQAKLTFHLISTLPMPRFELPKWDYMNFNPGDGSIPKIYLDDSHDVRVVPFNFSGDALIDAIVMSRPAYTNGTWPEYSEIQFLLNKGNGVFEDVTDSKLIGYNNASPTSYQPIFLDVNGDGRTDIFISSSDFSNYNSTAVLLQQANGTFLETGRDAFSNLYKSAVANVKSANLGYVFTDWGQPMQLVKGVNGEITVLGSVCYQNAQGGMSNIVFSSDLSFGNISFDETITGTVGNDTLFGGSGNDTLFGGAGNDSIYGGTGDDTLWAYLYYEDTSLSDTTFLSVLESERLNSKDKLFGGTGNDLYVIDQFANVPVVVENLNEGIDTILGDVQSYTIDANVENYINDAYATLNNVAQAIVINGNALDNIIKTCPSDWDTTSEMLSTLSTTFSAREVFYGHAGNDQLLSGLGDDFLDGGAGADMMYGGAGNDTYVVDNALDKVYDVSAPGSARNAGGIDTVQTSLNYKLGSFIENLTLTGTVGLAGTGNVLNNSITGTSGNDTLSGGAGLDTLVGGSGNDTYWVALTRSGKLEDTVTEESGTSSGIDSIKLTGSSTNYYAVAVSLNANIENLDISGTNTSLLNLTGNTSSNILIGNAAANILLGGSGNDALDGGTGSVADTIDGGEGIDTVSFATLTSTLTTGVTLNLGGYKDMKGYLTASGLGGWDKIKGVENILGSSYADNLTGDSTANILSGGSGRDALKGGAGNDTLIGGLGSDVLTGGDGKDVFIFNTAIANNVDKVMDFVAGTDKIQLSKSIFANVVETGNLTDNAFWSAAGAVTGHDSDDRVVYNTTTGSLYYDADGNGSGAAVQIAILGTSTHPTAVAHTDFSVIA